jgi:GrpB-like predicted nucleotidyltransferase (UPF0157 family)
MQYLQTRGGLRRSAEAPFSRTAQPRRADDQSDTKRGIIRGTILGGTAREIAMSQILPYAILSPTYVEYDSAAPAAAERVIALIEAAASWVKAEHIGSTAIPGCAGKGIVDLVVLYPRGRLEDTRQAVDSLGFQPQRAGHEFPDDRPMRVGAVEFDGRIYRLHAHIVAADSAEAKALYRFRDVLRIDAKLRDAYQAKKRAILESGTSDPAGYTHAKGEFINAVIGSSAA